LISKASEITLLLFASHGVEHQKTAFSNNMRKTSKKAKMAEIYSPGGSR
jgi:hypothetical protein